MSELSFEAALEDTAAAADEVFSVDAVDCASELVSVFKTVSQDEKVKRRIKTRIKANSFLFKKSSLLPNLHFSVYYQKRNKNGREK
jgi:hypothetical protein